MDLKSSVEALLYASKDPISVADMAVMLQEDRESIGKALRSLINEYRKRDTALKVARSGIRYKIELREEYHDIALPVAEPEFSQKEMAVLGFIASNPDARRGLLRDYFGEKYMDQVTRLRKEGLIRGEKWRNTELFSVTKKFYKHFNVSKEQIENISDSDTGT